MDKTKIENLIFSICLHAILVGVTLAGLSLIFVIVVSNVESAMYYFTRQPIN